MSSLISQDMKVQSGGLSLKEIWDKGKTLVKNIHDVAKKRKVLSGALKDMGAKNLGTFVEKQFGYGQKGGSLKAIEKAAEKEFGVKLGGRKKAVRKPKVVSGGPTQAPRKTMKKTRVPVTSLPGSSFKQTGGKGNPVIKVHI